MFKQSQTASDFLLSGTKYIKYKVVNYIMVIMLINVIPTSTEAISTVTKPVHCQVLLNCSKDNAFIVPGAMEHMGRMVLSPCLKNQGKNTRTR